MLQNYNKYKVLKVFLDSPTEHHRLREISRECGLAPLSVKNYLSELEKEKLVRKTVKHGIPLYLAERDDETFKLYKRISLILELHESGLVNYLWDKLSPDAIILYGSHSKGESTEDSDIDLALLGTGKTIDLTKFENLLKKRIHIITYQNLKDISVELRNNILNGLILKGYVKVF